MNTLNNGDIVTFETFKFRVIVESDDMAGAPWENEDGHGVVTEWLRRDKLSGERVLNCDHHAKRFYNVRESQAIAVRDGWGYGYEVEGETRRQRAARAVEADYQRLRAWCNNDWEYVAVGVQLVDDKGNDIDHPYAATVGYIGGVESDQLGDTSQDGHVWQLCDEIARDIGKYGLSYTPGEWK